MTTPEEVAENKTLWELLERTIDAYPTRTAVRIKEGKEWKSYTYADLGELSANLALSLIELGIEKRGEFGDRVVLLTENRPEFVISDLALKQIGAITSPAHKEYTASEVRYNLNDSAAKAIVVSTEAHFAKVMAHSPRDLPSLEHIIVTDPETFSEEMASLAARDPRVRNWSELIAPVQGGGKRDELAKRQKKFSPDDVTVLIYTSGTTSNPKGVMQTNSSLLFGIEKVLEIVPMPDPYVSLNILPLPHSFGYLADYLVPFATGGEVIYSPKKEFIENIKLWKPTNISGAPKLFERMQTGIRAKGGGVLGGLIEKGIQDVLKNPDSKFAPVLAKLGHKVTGGNLQFFVSGGAALDPELFRWIQTLGLEILQGYGMTEGVPFSVNPPGRRNKTGVGSAGELLAGLDALVEPVKDFEGNLRYSPTGETIGELYFAGPVLMKGYWRKPEETGKALVKKNGKIYMRTGDLGYVRELEADGKKAKHIFIVGREKDEIVLSTGKNVSPQETEELIVRSPEIAQAMLHGSENEYIGITGGKDRAYVTALIAVSDASLQKAAKAVGAQSTKLDDLLRNDAVLEYYRDVVQEQVRDLALYKRPKDIRLIREVTETDLWNVNGREYTPLTPTLKLKRQVVQTHFRALIDSMYGKNAGDVE